MFSVGGFQSISHSLYFGCTVASCGVWFHFHLLLKFPPHTTVREGLRIMHMSPPPGHAKLHQGPCCCQGISNPPPPYHTQSRHPRLVFNHKSLSLFFPGSSLNYFNLPPFKGPFPLGFYICTDLQLPRDTKRGLVGLCCSIPSHSSTTELSVMLPNLSSPFPPPSTVWCLISHSLELLCTYRHLS